VIVQIVVFWVETCTNNYFSKDYQAPSSGEKRKTKNDEKEDHNLISLKVIRNTVIAIWLFSARFLRKLYEFFTCADV
jgi:hypothetical protein